MSSTQTFGHCLFGRLAILLPSLPAFLTHSLLRAAIWIPPDLLITLLCTPAGLRTMISGKSTWKEAWTSGKTLGQMG